MNTTKIAVIGAGLIGKRHAEVILDHSQCTLVGLVDPHACLDSLKTEFDAPCFRQLKDMLQTQSPDAVIIATPNDTHASIFEVCAPYINAALIEKPIADTLENARKIVALSKQHQVPVLVGHHRRHNALIKKTKAIVQAPSFGKLIGISVLWALTKPDEYFDVAWRKKMLVGGPTLINLVHDLDSLRYICGEISQVYAHASSAVRGFDVEDTLSISLQFDNGALGTVLASDTCASPWSYETNAKENKFYFHADQSCYHFLGTRAALAFPTMDLWRYKDDKKVGWQHPMHCTPIKVEVNDPLTEQLTHLLDITQKGCKPILDAEGGFLSLALALSVQLSAGTNQPVILNEFLKSGKI
jgi:predicted dehydrogenase